MRTLILGGGGMLGHKVFEALHRDHPCWATFRAAAGAARAYPFYADRRRRIENVDASDWDSVTAAFSAVRPEAVINCIGIIKQKKEARQALPSIRINALFPHRLAALCAACGARLVHVSTDCVYSGEKGGYRESDPPDAHDLYGRSKALGEVEAEGVLTLRTSIVGWDLTKSDGLLEWALSRRGQRVQGYRNAVFSGLSTSALATVIGELLKSHPGLSGLHHVSADPIDKHRLLTMVNQALDLGMAIEPSEEPRVDRSLDSSKFRAATGIKIPRWPEMVEQLAAERGRYDEWKTRHGNTHG